MSENESTDTMDRLLRRLADQFTGPSGEVPGVRAPEWFDRAGDLVVVDGNVSWTSPGSEGGFHHEMPPGTYPVYVGTFGYVEDAWHPDGIHYRTSMIVIPFAEPARIGAAEWGDGYDDYQQLDDYALLCDGRAGHAADDSLLAAATERILAEGPFHRRHNWVDVVVDQPSGANVMVFPASGEAVQGIEARDDDDELLCLMFVGCDY